MGHHPTARRALLWCGALLTIGLAALASIVLVRAQVRREGPAAVVGALRTICSAQGIFHASRGRYAGSLAELEPGARAAVERVGTHRFALRADRWRFLAVATPASPGERWLAMDQAGSLHGTLDGEPIHVGADLAPVASSLVRIF